MWRRWISHWTRPTRLVERIPKSSKGARPLPNCRSGAMSGIIGSSPGRFFVVEWPAVVHSQQLVGKDRQSRIPQQLLLEPEVRSDRIKGWRLTESAVGRDPYCKRIENETGQAAH